MSQAMLPPDELSFNESKARQPMFLSSLYEKRLPQKTLSLPSTPQPDSNEPSLYSFTSSALRVDDSSFISSIISPSLSRSSYQIITCSEFILRDVHPTKQRRSFFTAI
ncbi:hypothetical protein DSO57_1014382 [Entomophthora muscae]|uniref:Uncharacterized protein n=1 Tax=Entomophthora muscae TaxID=34485 RepID=A0ACC2TGK4_9FUNG|nr:hypothetical protein DSO57_1014382 [Entomophthora muscae]